MRHIILFLLFINVVYTGIAQQIKIEGTLQLSSDSSTVIGAHILAQDKSQNILAETVSDVKGHFLIYVNANIVSRLLIKSIGLRPVYWNVDGIEKNIDLGIIYLEENPINLKEVSVVSNNHNVNNQLLFPNKKQIKSSNDLFSLLMQLNLNGLSISHIDKTVSINDKGVQWLINGIPRTYQDVQNISPKDILRIEYSDTPSTRYIDQGIGGIINIILHNRVKGGSIRSSLQTALWTGFINGSLSAEHSLGKSIFSLNYSGSYRNYSKWKRDIEQKFISDVGNPITRNEQGENSPFGYNTHDINFAYFYQPDNQSQLSVTWRNSIGMENKDIRSIINETGSSIYHRSTNSTYKSYMPALDLFYQQNFSKNAKLELNLLATHIRGRGDRTLYDNLDGSLIRNYKNPTLNRYGSLIGEIAYRHKIGLSTEISSGVNYKWSNTTNTYYSPNITIENLRTHNLYAYTQLSGSILRNMQFNIGAGYKNLYTDNSQTERIFGKFQGRLGLLYSPIQNLHLSLNSYFTPTLPYLSQLSRIEQKYDTYVTYTGNPMLSSSYNYNNNLQVSYNAKQFNSSITFRYNYTDSPIYTNIRYRPIEKDWLYETNNAVYNSNIGIEWKGAIQYIFGILSIYGKLGYKIFKSKLDDIVYSEDDLYGDISAQINYKEWTLSTYYAYRPKSLYTFNLSETKPEIGATIMWNKGNWILYTQVFYLASRYGDYYRESRLSPVNPMTSIITIGDNKNMLSIGAVWTFKYGKEIKSKERNTQNYDSSNSIVKVQ